VTLNLSILFFLPLGNFLLHICLKDIIRELFDTVNKGGFKERFHSKLYKSNVLYLVQSESYAKLLKPTGYVMHQQV
jgi:hypothetical protein